LGLGAVADWTGLLHSAQALQRAGKPGEAETFYRQALIAAPQEAATHHLFGLLRMEQKRFEDAESLLCAACACTPHPPEALLHHALSLAQLGRFEQALTVIDRLVALKPDAAGAWNNRAELLVSLGRHAEALADFDRALARNPRLAQALEGRGNLLLISGRAQDALDSFDKALALQPHSAEAWLGKGRALLELRHPGEAAPCFDRALASAPDHPDVWFYRGIGLDDLGYFDEAIQCYDRTITLRPQGLGARNNRSVVLQRLKRYRDAAQGYCEILELSPGNDMALNGLANCALYSCDWTQTENFAQSLRTRIQDGAVMQLGTVLGYFSDPALHLTAAQNYVKHLWPVTEPALWRGPRFAGKRIRVAYCSANFNAHPMPRLLAGMFEHHDRDAFEIIAMSYGPDDQSEMRQRLTRAFDQFHDVANKSVRQIAQKIAELGVDIAVDLMGHTNGGRGGIFAARPAPVQVNYMGFPGTLGTDFHDYIIGDGVILPMDQQDFYTEKIVQLPGSYLANDDQRPYPASIPSRAEAGLPEQGFVFCCFNNNWKITAPIFAIWMRLLGQVQGSVLWLLEDNREAADHLRAHAQAHGIAPERLIFAPRATPEAHLARHRLADLFLDTVPYNAHTTASDSLWVGVPLITLQDAAFHSRVAASALPAIGMPELITRSFDDYENLALSLAQSPERLQALRRRLDANRPRASLFNTARFTRNMENAYHTMAAIFREGQTPRAITVTEDDQLGVQPA